MYPVKTKYIKSIGRHVSIYQIHQLQHQSITSKLSIYLYNNTQCTTRYLMIEKLLKIKFIFLPKVIPNCQYNHLSKYQTVFFPQTKSFPKHVVVEYF